MTETKNEISKNVVYEAPVLEEFSYSKLTRVRGASGCDVAPGGDDCGADSEEEF